MACLRRWSKTGLASSVLAEEVVDPPAVVCDAAGPAFGGELPSLASGALPPAPAQPASSRQASARPLTELLLVDLAKPAGVRGKVGGSAA
jgi:hypothetical protein